MRTGFESRSAFSHWKFKKLILFISKNNCNWFFKKIVFISYLLFFYVKAVIEKIICFLYSSFINFAGHVSRGKFFLSINQIEGKIFFRYDVILIIINMKNEFIYMYIFFYIIYVNRNIVESIV